MAITTGGGVAFSESANSRANREQLLGQMNNAQAQMQQESQFKRKQALDTANQMFGQEIKMGLASGNLEKYIAEHPQNFAAVEQLMSGAIGRQVSMAEALQQGLGATSAGFAENPSLQRMTYEYLQRLPGQVVAPGGERAGGEKANNTPTPAPASAIGGVPATNKASSGPGMAVQERPVNEAVGVLQTPAGVPVANPGAESGYKAVKLSGSGGGLSGFVLLNKDGYRVMPAGRVQPYGSAEEALEDLQKNNTSGNPALQISDQAFTLPEGTPTVTLESFLGAKEVVPPDSNQRIQQAEKPVYEGGRTQGQPLSQGVGSSVAEFAQGYSSDAQTPAEQAGRAIQASRRAQAAVPIATAGPPQQLQKTPGFAAWANRPATVQESGTVPSGPNPKAQEALSRIEQKTSAPVGSDTPIWDAKQVEAAKTKFTDAFTKAVDLSKSLISGDASKSLKQSDKAALAAAQTRAMALSEKIKGMDEGEYQKVRAEYVKWIESATPMELQAAGLPEVATKAESIWLARFQANAAIEAAQARGGSETAAAIIDMRGKAMDQVRGILEIANTAAKNDPNYKGDIAKFFEKNPMYSDMLVPFASMAFGQPVKIDMILKDPTWFQKLLKQPGNVQGLGVSVNNWEGARERPAATTAASPVSKYYAP